MATYKKGFKKQSSEQVLLKVIVAIIAAVLVFVGIVYIYDVSSNWRDYSSYTHITEYGTISDYTNEDEVELEDYVVYFYSTNCEGCNDLKNDALRLVNKINRGEDQVFLVNTSNMTDASTGYEPYVEEINAVHSELLENVFTPSIAIYVDGELHEYIYGSDLLVTLEGIQDGTYEPFNN